MRSRHALIIALVALALIGLWIIVGSESLPAASAQTEPDDEIAYIDYNTYVQIYDPYVAPGNERFAWTSPSNGWRGLAPLDANADGVYELVAFGAPNGTPQLLLMTPHVPQGTTAPQFSRSGSIAYNWVAAGDIVPGDGGRDEILAQRSDNTIQIWDGNDAGTEWNLIYDSGQEERWSEIAIGDVDGVSDGGDEIVMIGGKRLKILKYRGTNNFDALINDGGFGFDWVALDLGNTHSAYPGEEIILSRDVPNAASDTFLMYYYANRQLNKVPSSWAKYWPFWTAIGSGDVNGSGLEQVFMVRDPKTTSGVSMFGRNWSSVPIAAAWSSPGLRLGRNLKKVEVGDIDGDGIGEAVAAQPGQFLFFNQPAANTSYTTKSASFSDPIWFRLGNFDGGGIPAIPPELSVDKTFIQFEIERGEPNPPDSTFTVTNIGGGGSIAYSVTKSPQTEWLTVTPFDGATPGVHTVSVDAAGLPAGTYDATITITADRSDVGNSPLYISVRFIITPTGPALGVLPTSIDITTDVGDSITPIDLEINNIGDGGPLQYTISATTQDGGAWLVLNKTGGWTNDVVKVTIDTDVMHAGEYNGTIHVDAGDVEGSPRDIPVHVLINSVTMTVNPTAMLMQATLGLPTPRANISIGQADGGMNGIHWYAYAVPSGDWWNVQSAYAKGELTVKQAADGFVFTAPDGTEQKINYVPWVLLSPGDGWTPGVLQISFDMATIPFGDHRITILVDGGPGTLERFQGVDLRVIVGNGLWLPKVAAN